MDTPGECPCRGYNLKWFSRQRPFLAQGVEKLKKRELEPQIVPR